MAKTKHEPDDKGGRPPKYQKEFDVQEQDSLGSGLPKGFPCFHSGSPRGKRLKVDRCVKVLRCGRRAPR